MVPGRLSLPGRRVALIALLGLALPLVTLAPGGAAPARDPGAFWPLVVGYQGQTYRDALPRGASYALAGGQLPLGVDVRPDGTVTGTPQELGTFQARVQAVDSAGRRWVVRVALTVRKEDESDVPAATPAFTSNGTFQVDTRDVNVDVDPSSFDGSRFTTPVRLYLPRGATRRPLLLHHRGRGFDHDDYDALLTRIASYGIAVASVKDQLSFTGSSFSALSPDYDRVRAELGMESASGVMEAVCDRLLLANDDPQSSVFNAFDPENLFWSGHSRGGGAVHASHERSFLLRLKGLIYLMAFDLRYFAECRPPGAAPAYPIADATARTPSLILVGENDGDLVYPIADQLIERATGPTTQVTIYGGVHNLISDSHPSEGTARISRTTEQTRVADWVVCFIKRWAEGRDDLDRRLYLGGHQDSRNHAVSSWYPSARTRVLEDAQDADAARNRVGRNQVAGLRRTEASIYPEVGDMRSVGIRHTVLTPVDQVSVWRVGSDTPLDITTSSRLVMRLGQTGTQGFAGLGVWVRLVDAAGGIAWARVYEPQSGGSLPAWSGFTPLDRLIDVHVPWSAFSDATSPGLDRTRVVAVDLVLVQRDPSRVDAVVADQLRLE